jgi:hypothetical protein
MPTCRQTAEESALPSSAALQHPNLGDGPDNADGMGRRCTDMTRLPVLIMVGLLAAAPRASAACRWFGTQLECGVGARRVVVGTQAAEQPTYARSFPIHSFHDGSGFDDRAASRSPLEIQLQDFAADPSLCRTIGNETYCY